MLPGYLTLPSSSTSANANMETDHFFFGVGMKGLRMDHLPKFQTEVLHRMFGEVVNTHPDIVNWLLEPRSEAVAVSPALVAFSSVTLRKADFSHVANVTSRFIRREANQVNVPIADIDGFSLGLVFSWSGEIPQEDATDLQIDRYVFHPSEGASYHATVLHDSGALVLSVGRYSVTGLLYAAAVVVSHDGAILSNFRAARECQYCFATYQDRSDYTFRCSCRAPEKDSYRWLDENAVQTNSWPSFVEKCQKYSGKPLKFVVSDLLQPNLPSHQMSMTFKFEIDAGKENAGRSMKRWESGAIHLQIPAPEFPLLPVGTADQNHIGDGSGSDRISSFTWTESSRSGSIPNCEYASEKGPGSRSRSRSPELDLPQSLPVVTVPEAPEASLQPKKMIKSRSPSVCTICHRVFSRPFTLQRHLETSHREVPLKRSFCNYCPASFSQRSNRDRHHAKMHSVFPSNKKGQRRRFTMFAPN